MRLVALALAGVLVSAGAASAHDGVDHGSAAKAAGHAAAGPATERAAPADGSADGPANGPALPFPGRIGGAYHLVDQFGAPRDQRDPDGQPQLIFFGYAECKAICSTALPRMAEAVDLLAARGVTARPVLITVDPAHDTPETMRAALAALHPRFVGLTGDEPSLAAARAAFQVEAKQVAELPDGSPVFAHGTFVYLMDGQGGFLTLMPPILGPERMAEIAMNYVRP